MKRYVSLRQKFPRPRVLAQFGLICLTNLVLAACSGNPPKPATVIALSETPASEIAPIDSATPAIDNTAAPGTSGAVSFWDRLRQRFALPGCDYRPEVLRFARVYTGDPGRFAASLAAAMPFLLLVTEQIEQYDLPGEFAFLPYVESTYIPFASRGDRPAGIWQIVPDTGRAFGLTLNRDYDGRLDVYASSVAVMTLLRQYQQEFNDWRLTNMAFNAGEYRIKQLMTKHPAPLSATELAHLKLSPITHEHLAKLLALACVISDPQRFQVQLPQPQPDDALKLIELHAPVSLPLAARIAQLTEAQLRRFNPGYLHNRMPTHGPYRLLIPTTHADDFEQTLNLLPQAQWSEWHTMLLKQSESISAVASRTGIASETLAKINHSSDDAQLPAGTRLLVPGEVESTVIARSADTAGQDLASHTVKAGDTLWDIAQHYRVALEDLLRWNHLTRDSTLHMGQRLHLSASP